MPRVNYVRAARRDQGSCDNCSTPLLKGQAYRWWKFRYGGKRKRCMATSCNPMPWDLTNSPKRQSLYRLQHDAAQLGGSRQDVVDGLSGVAEDARNLGEEWRESAEAKREYFPDDETAEYWVEFADELEIWADQADELADEITEEVEDWNPDEDEIEEGDTDMEIEPPSMDDEYQDDEGKLEDLVSELPEPSF